MYICCAIHVRFIYDNHNYMTKRLDYGMKNKMLILVG